MSSSNPLVSIVVPVLNGERSVERALNSALAQTYDPIEIIVVDDGSTDRTIAIVEAMASRDRRIRLFRRPHSGVSASRNFGAGQARGTLLAPLDADDLWHPDKLSAQVAAMLASPGIGVVYSWAVEIDENDFIILPIRNGRTASGDVLHEVAAKAGIIDSGGNSLIRRSCFEAVGGYDAGLRYAEDWKLYLALAEICEFAVVPLHHVGYRRTTRSASRNVAAMAEGMELVSRWIVARHPDMPAKVIREMAYSRNCYLAHLAMTTNQLRSALRHQMMAYAALPVEIFSSASLIFVARLIARLLGLRRSTFAVPTTTPASFIDFQSEPEPPIVTRKD
jgi:glycosyltransferase involved in cell wall biosynthesis